MSWYCPDTENCSNFKTAWETFTTLTFWFGHGPFLSSLVHPPGCNEIQQVLPALADFVEFVLDFRRLAVLAGPGQTLTHNLQLLLVLLSDTDLLLVVLVCKHT